MHLLFTRFPLESRFGGAEVQILSLMKGLKERGHDVRFLGSCKELLAMSDQQSATPLEIGAPPVTKWGSIRFLWRRFSMKRKLISAIKNLTANSSPLTAIFMVSLSEKLLLTRWAHNHGIRVIWIEHDSVGRWLTHNPWLPRLRKLSRLAKTVCVSDLSATLYLRMKWRPKDIVVIPNGISLERFLGAEINGHSQRTMHNVQLRIGCVARLHREKGVDLLIDAVKNLPDVSLTVVGTGPEEQALKEQIGNLDNISIIPNIPDLAEFYRSIDVFVLPSRSNDPFGLVAGEAMMLGIPTIVTSQCGISCYLDGITDAIVVKSNSKEALLEAIKSLQDPVRRNSLSITGKRTANRLFTVGKMVEAYERLAQD